MPNSLISIIYYETKTIIREAHSWLTPLIFFIIVVCLFPFAVGPDPALLSKIAPGIVWVSALLAILISIDKLFRYDAKEGYLDLLLLSPMPLTLLVLSKVVGHWLTHCLPLVCISPLLGFLLHLPGNEVYALTMSLLLGTPVLVLIGAIGAALVVGVRNHGLLLPILIMPLYIPILIFGTCMVTAASLHQPISGYLAIMGAFMLLSLAFAPYLTSIALRIGVNQ